MSVPSTALDSAERAASGARARARWQAMPPRERRLVAVAAGLVLAAIAWWLLLAPALATLRTAPARHAALDAQLTRMRGLQAQAQSLQSQPRHVPPDAARLLEAGTRELLGERARVVLAGDRATVTLSGVPGDAFARWLAHVRVNARALPEQARLNRSGTGAWDGTLTLTLPTPR